MQQQEKAGVQISTQPWLEKEECQKLFLFVISVIVLLCIHFAPNIEGLEPEAKSILGVFVWFMIVTMSNSLNNFAVGLAAPLLVVILTGMKPAQAFNAFASDTFFLTIGAFTFAGVMTATPLGKRIALGITSLFRSSKISKIFTGLTMADVAINSFLPSVAETGLLLPIVKGFQGLMAGKEADPNVQRINKGLMMLICGFMPLVTGLLILTAHLPNMLLVGFLEDRGIAVSFLDWFKLNLPLWGLIPLTIIYIMVYYRLWGLEIPNAEKELPEMKKSLGPITRAEIWALCCLGVCFVLWVTEGSLHQIKTGMVALILVVLLFMPFGKLKFSTVMPHILWDVWIMLGGAISLGTELSNSGAIEWLIGLLLTPLQAHLLGLPIILVLLLVALVTHIPRAGIVSAGAMGAMFIPLTITMAQQLGFQILPFSLIITNCLSYAFFLPMSITAFFIAWGASGMSMWEGIKLGVPFTLLCNIYVVVTLALWLPLIGYPLI